MTKVRLFALDSKSVPWCQLRFWFNISDWIFIPIWVSGESELVCDSRNRQLIEFNLWQMTDLTFSDTTFRSTTQSKTLIRRLTSHTHNWKFSRAIPLQRHTHSYSASAINAGSIEKFQPVSSLRYVHNILFN